MIFATNVGNHEHEVVVEYTLDYCPAEPEVGLFVPQVDVIDFRVVEFNGLDRYDPTQWNSDQNWNDLDRLGEKLIPECELVEHYADQMAGEEEYALESRWEFA